MDRNLIEERMLRLGVEAGGIYDRDKLRKLAVESLKEDDRRRDQKILELNSDGQNPFRKQIELDPNGRHFYFYRMTGKRQEIVKIHRENLSDFSFEIREEESIYPWIVQTSENVV